jgi:hypothetical protein
MYPVFSTDIFALRIALAHSFLPEILFHVVRAKEERKADTVVAEERTRMR